VIPIPQLHPARGPLRFGRRTYFVRNLAGVEAGIRARNPAQRAAIRAVTARGLERALHSAQDLCPRDSGYMALHMRAELTHEGFGFRLGWHRDDFVGQINTLVEPNRLITDFYPVFVVFGTRHMQGRDPISPALRAERPNLLRGYARALQLRAA
jgi:hypothetical protein